MYGVPSVSVEKRIPVEIIVEKDKGLGFDFSAITNLVKSALPVGLNLYQQQMQLKQIKAMGGQTMGYMPNPSLPMANSFAAQPTFGAPMYVPPQAGMSTTTMLLLGLGAVGAVVAFIAMKK